MALPLSPATLAAVAAALVVVVLLVAFIIRQRAQASAGVLGGAAGGSGKRKAADSVVLVGPTGSGKTVLLHQVRAGARRGRRARGRTVRACGAALGRGGPRLPEGFRGDAHVRIAVGVTGQTRTSSSLVHAAGACPPPCAHPSPSCRSCAARRPRRSCP